MKSIPATNERKERQKEQPRNRSICTANSDLICCTYRQRGRLASSRTSRRRRHSRYLDTYTYSSDNRCRPYTKRLAASNGRRCGIWVPTHVISLTHFLPAAIGVIHILLGNCFADEEQPGSPGSCRWCRCNSTLGDRVVDVCAAFAAADLGTALRLGLTPVEP